MSPPITDRTASVQKEKEEQYNRNKSDGDDKSRDIVDWNGQDDPEHPQNMPSKKKWFVTMVYGLMTLVVTFASSVYSTATEVTAAEFNVSSEVMTLATALTVLVSRLA